LFGSSADMRLGQDILLPSLAENVLIAGVDVALVLVAHFGYGWGLIDTFGLLMLIEAAVLMLIGGAMEFSTSSAGRAFVSFFARRDSAPSGEDSRRLVMRAATFTLVGVLLFLESLGLALLA